MITLIVFKPDRRHAQHAALGGIAIALERLVDDSVVDVENILRRLGENRRKPKPLPVMTVMAEASAEVLRHRLYHLHRPAGVHPAVRHAGPAGADVLAWQSPTSSRSSPV
ncbi:MAG: hypothetical protein U1E53_00805 [Dongiaceae bacterium]